LMTIVVCGAKGQLGCEVVRSALHAGYQVVSAGRDDLSITSESSVHEFLATYLPDIVINCAAYTAVDRAEAEPDLADLVNVQGSRNLARATAARSIRFVQVSTDYVFGGGREGNSTSLPLTETDTPAPLGVYGFSKLRGEQAVAEENSKALIVRTSSVFGVHGQNFVKTMCRLFATRDEVRVVADQYMKPTYAGWLGNALVTLSGTSCSGILHAAGDGAISWYDFARAIRVVFLAALEENNVTHGTGRNQLLSQIVTASSAQIETLQDCRILPISAEEYPTPARRPLYSVLDCSRLKNEVGIVPPHWEQSLSTFFSEWISRTV